MPPCASGFDMIGVLGLEMRRGGWEWEGGFMKCFLNQFVVGLYRCPFLRSGRQVERSEERGLEVCGVEGMVFDLQEVPGMGRGGPWSEVSIKKGPYPF